MRRDLDINFWFNWKYRILDRSVLEHMFYNKTDK